jgi:putative hydrolase of the HAD superfamily
MVKVKAVFFDLDDTLYDTTLQVKSARENAVKAMIGCGLHAEYVEAMEKLRRVVVKYGANYKYHYNELLREFGVEEDPKIIAAGIVAYHETKKAYLVPYPDTIPTLLELERRQLSLGVVTDGVPVKQWEKLIRLGLQHFFNVVVVTPEGGKQKPDASPLLNAAESVGAKPAECVFVGDRLDRDIAAGNKAGFTTVQLMKGHYSGVGPKDGGEEPDYIIPDLESLLTVLEEIEKEGE